MDGMKGRHTYRPLYKHLRIGTREYAILDQDIASERAEQHLNEALRTLDAPASEEKQLFIDTELTYATDFGCKDAPYLLALRILDRQVATRYALDESVVFLKLAAERGHGEAAFRLACSYAQMGNFKEIEQAGLHYFSSLDSRRRARMAEQYFQMAIDLKHQEAAAELIIAYAYGRGFILQDAHKFNHLCERQILKGNQSVALGYGAWMAGMTVEGNDPLEEAINIEQDPDKALTNLLKAAKGENLELAQHALHLICMAMQRELWPRHTWEKLGRKLLRDATTGNQLLALYIAWYSIPLSMRPVMPKLLEHYQLTQISSLFAPDKDVAAHYLEKAFFGQHHAITMVAKHLMVECFGDAFWEGEEVLVGE